MTTTKLTDTQLVILTQAAQHPRLALTIPPHLKGGAVSKVIGPLLGKGFVEEIEPASDLPVYRTRGDGSRTALFIPGLTAIGMEPKRAEEGHEEPKHTGAQGGREAGPRAVTSRGAQDPQGSPPGARKKPSGRSAARGH